MVLFILQYSSSDLLSVPVLLLTVPFFVRFRSYHHRTLRSSVQYPLTESITTSVTFPFCFSGSVFGLPPSRFPSTFLFCFFSSVLLHHPVDSSAEGLGNTACTEARLARQHDSSPRFWLFDVPSQSRFSVQLHRPSVLVWATLLVRRLGSHDNTTLPLSSGFQTFHHSPAFRSRFIVRRCCCVLLYGVTIASARGRQHGSDDGTVKQLEQPASRSEALRLTEARSLGLSLMLSLSLNGHCSFAEFTHSPVTLSLLLNFLFHSTARLTCHFACVLSCFNDRCSAHYYLFVVTLLVFFLASMR